jgi:hypothetical protein
MNRDDITRSIVAVLIIVGFFAVVMVALLGFVDIREPSIAKLVGMLAGYFTAMLNPIIVRYFGSAT